MTDTPPNPTRRVDYDPATETYHTNFDPDVSSPSARIVSAVAAITGRPPHDLPSLYDVIEVDALNQIFQRGFETGRAVQVTFTYADHHITIGTTGFITIDPSPDE